MQRYYTIETRLELKENPQLKEYLDTYVTLYNLVYRYVYRELISPQFKAKYKTKAKFDTYIGTKYGLLKRTVNSIRNEAEGKIKALKELKKYERTQLKSKIKTLETKCKKKKQIISDLKSFVTLNNTTFQELRYYRDTQKSLYFTQKKLNKLKQQLANLEQDIKQGRVIIGFGGKSLFKKQYLLTENNYRTHTGWYIFFIKARDKNIYYRGSSDESQGNQLLQLIYNKDKDTFQAKLRKEKQYSSESNYLNFTCNFKYLKDNLKEMLKGDYPLSYRFVRRGPKWYLQAIVIIRKEEKLTRSNSGVLGLDFNEGFIALTETDRYGNLINQKHIQIGKHSSNKTKTLLREKVYKICKYALLKGKDIVIEDLDFKRTKRKTIKAKSKKGKSYNRMLHRLDYSRYKETMEGTSYRLGVGLKLVNPFNTSKIGKQKYSSRMKLNNHQAASYVIARRGQGFKANLVVN